MFTSDEINRVNRSSPISNLVPKIMLPIIIFEPTQGNINKIKEDKYITFRYFKNSNPKDSNCKNSNCKNSNCKDSKLITPIYNKYKMIYRVKGSTFKKYFLLCT